MRLTRFTITNHSRLHDASVDIRDHMVLIGPNDVGKSSILRCLNLLLGASTAQLFARLTESDLRDPAEDMVAEAVLDHISDSEVGLFADEIDVDASGERTLLLRLEVGVDDAGTLEIRRYFPNGGTGRQLSREQLSALGWRMISAHTGERDVRQNGDRILSEVLSALNLEGERADFDAIVATLQTQLDTSNALATLRSGMASQMSKALPQDLTDEDFSFRTGSTPGDDPLHDVHLQVRKAGEFKPLEAQSDGAKAMFALALYDMVSAASNMVAIDEPEVHLHPSSQRSLGRLLVEGPNQKFISTHSADIASSFQPDCIVRVQSGGRMSQPPKDFLSGDEKLFAHWWVRDKLEPLTAQSVGLVEGISDRIIVERAAALTQRSLDRLGVSLMELDGAGDLGAVYRLFGPDSLSIPLHFLIDDDARDQTANALNVLPADLPSHGVLISSPDLEAEYVAAIGPTVLATALESSHLFTPNEIKNLRLPHDETNVAEFCRGKRGYKVRAALVAASIMTAEQVNRMVSVDAFLTRLTIL